MLSERINSHRSDIRNRNITDKPVAAHLNMANHCIDDMELTIIEKIRNDDTNLRRIRENRWINILQTIKA